jgi:hypothetical protein
MDHPTEHVAVPVITSRFLSLPVLRIEKALVLSTFSFEEEDPATAPATPVKAPKRSLLREAEVQLSLVLPYAIDPSHLALSIDRQAFESSEELLVRVGVWGESQQLPVAASRPTLYQIQLPLVLPDSASWSDRRNQIDLRYVASFPGLSPSGSPTTWRLRAQVNREKRLVEITSLDDVATEAKGGRPGDSVTAFTGDILSRMLAFFLRPRPPPAYVPVAVVSTTTA